MSKYNEADLSEIFKLPTKSKKYKVQITQFSNSAAPRTVVDNQYTEVVEADNSEGAESFIRGWNENPKLVTEYAQVIDVDVDVLGEADPSEPVTFPGEPCEECGGYCWEATEIWRTNEGQTA